MIFFIDPDLLGWVRRPDIENVQTSIFWFNLVNRYALVMICVISKRDLGVGEMGFIALW